MLDWHSCQICYPLEIKLLLLLLLYIHTCMYNSVVKLKEVFVKYTLLHCPISNPKEKLLPSKLVV